MYSNRSILGVQSHRDEADIKRKMAIITKECVRFEELIMTAKKVGTQLPGSQ